MVDAQRRVTAQSDAPNSTYKTGNITNADLEKVVCANLTSIEAAFASSRFVEITRDALVIHE
jgi:predicted nuclease of predicted toxin-antitoxin system